MVFQVLLVQGVQQRVAGTVGCGCGTRRLLAAEVQRLAAERALIDAAVVQTRERQAHVFQFQNRFRAGFTHIFDGVTVTDIVGTFHRVVHMPFPVVLVAVAQRDGDAALCRHGMGTGRENFGQQGTGRARLGNLQRGTHARTAGADYDGIKLSDWQFHLSTPHYDCSVQ